MWAMLNYAGEAGEAGSYGRQWQTTQDHIAIVKPAKDESAD